MSRGVGCVGPPRREFSCQTKMTMWSPKLVSHGAALTFPVHLFGGGGSRYQCILRTRLGDALTTPQSSDCLRSGPHKLADSRRLRAHGAWSTRTHRVQRERGATHAQACSARHPGRLSATPAEHSRQKRAERGQHEESSTIAGEAIATPDRVGRTRTHGSPRRKTRSLTLCSFCVGVGVGFLWSNHEPLMSPCSCFGMNLSRARGGEPQYEPPPAESEKVPDILADA